MSDAEDGKSPIARFAPACADFTRSGSGRVLVLRDYLSFDALRDNVKR